MVKGRFSEIMAGQVEVRFVKRKRACSDSNAMVLVPFRPDSYRGVSGISGQKFPKIFLMFLVRFRSS